MSCECNQDAIIEIMKAFNHAETRDLKPQDSIPSFFEEIKV